MSDCIFGIKCNGLSISVSQITIDDDQSNFDYICNVSLKNSWNGNGEYDVSIINKDYIQGMQVGKWRITKARIYYDWVDSRANFKMEDEDGNETCNIIAGIQRRTVNGYDVASSARAIFTKAQEIVRDYPNAKICSSIIELQNSKIMLNLENLKDYLKKSKVKGDEEYNDAVSYVIGKLSNHLDIYNHTKEMLQNQDDVRSKQLLKDIVSDCKNLLDRFKD